MSELNFKVDEQKCIHCGLCVKDCITSVLEQQDSNSAPKAVAPQRCMACQHCMTICPVGAISVFDKNPDESEKLYSQNPDMVLNLIKSRRSNRQYKHENVSPDIMQKLKDMLPWVPTGCNYHKLHFSFIDDVNVMDEFRNYTNNKIVNALTKAPIKAVMEKFSSFTKAFINGDDIVFRGAPHMLVVSNSVKAPCAKEDAVIALSYFELYAQSLGIGTCWCGYGEMVMKVFPELCDYLEIPQGYSPQYVMLFGPKEVNYQRSIQPEPVSIVSAKAERIQKLSVGKKLKRCFWNFIR